MSQQDHHEVQNTSGTEEQTGIPTPRWAKMPCRTICQGQGILIGPATPGSSRGRHASHDTRLQPAPGTPWR